jgi:hypothetical protein
MENVATYSEARSEYTKQLATFIVPAMVQWFQHLWHRNSTNRQQAMYLFQTECEEIPRWNQDRVQDEVRALVDRTGCDYMEELMTAVFVAHTKVLTAVRMSARQQKLSITVPKLDHFIHRIFREAARSFWKSPFLFMDNGNVVERQKNVLQIEALATEAITSAVRSLLPVKQILKDYLEDDTEEIEDEVVEREAPVNVPEPVVEQAVVAPVTVAAPVMEEEKPDEPDNYIPIASKPAPAEVVEQPALVVSEVPAEPVKIVEPEQVKQIDTSSNQVEASVPASAPAIVKIDTEAAVHFSDYDSVFDETQGAPELRYAPKDDEDDDDMPSDGILKINEDSTSVLSDSDAEDLDAPVSDELDDSEFVVLE